MHILLVEDEEISGRYLHRALTECGFVVDWTRSGVDGLHHAVTLDYQLLILEVKLPGIDGWEVLRALRRTHNTPVLFLSVCASVEERVKGLELGADDFLAKPFSLAELLARIRSLLRRGPPRQQEVIDYAGVRLDVLKRRVSRNGRRIELTAREFALLHMLISRPGEVFARARIASLVWDMNFDSDTNVVDVAVRRLRAKLEDEGSEKLLHTVWGVGYVFEWRGPLSQDAASAGP